MEQRLKEPKSPIIKVAITGPESTGKSVLAKALSERYNTCYNPEYAREYLDKLSRPYTYNDVELIGLEQKEREEEHLPKAHKILFCDTDLLVIRVWMDFKYGRHPQWVDDWLLNGGYSLFVLCNIDSPWEPDPLREHPEAREQLYNIYLSELQKNKQNFVIASGSHQNRLHIVDEALKQLS